MAQQFEQPQEGLSGQGGLSKRETILTDQPSKRPETPPDSGESYNLCELFRCFAASIVLNESEAHVCKISNPSSPRLGKHAEGCFLGERVQLEVVANPPHSELHSLPATDNHQHIRG